MVELVGIVNVTPDSFSDGGQHFVPRDAAAAAVRLRKDGASIIDIGAESTRPGAIPITPEEEWQRLAPVLEALPRLPFSIDTRHAGTAKKALAAGAQWINDVSGFSDPAMVDAVKASNCKLVVMHSLSVPADRSVVFSDTVDAVQEVLAFAKVRLAQLEAAGIARARLIFDPGIGFGKTAAQSQALIDNIRQFVALGVPILVGHSRKSFLAQSNERRDAATLRLSQFLAAQGVAYLRVHDVAAHAALFAAQQATA